MKLFYLSTLALATAANAAITFNINYVNAAGETWDSARQAVVNKAANEWGNLFIDDYSIDVDVTFTNGGSGGYLGQWAGSRSFFNGEDIKPWDNTSHEIRFNADRMDTGLSNYLWWDPSNLNDNSDQPFVAWDALSVARHEFGHLVGFTDNFYVDNINTPGEIDFWDDQLSGSTPKIFDASGLNIQLHTDDTHLANSGVSASDLMNPAIPNSVRREISQLDVDILTTAYGFNLASIPEPSTIGLLVGLAGLAFGARRRRRV